MSGHPDELLSAFLDGELSAADRAAVEGHLRDCAACARELEELAAVDAFARELPVPAPAGYFEALPGRVRARVRRPARIPRPALWAVAAAAAVMAVVVTPVVLQHERSVVAPPAPAAQAVPQGPAPATLAASIAPAPRSFAQPADAGSGARPFSPAKSEVRGRLQEREEADKPAENVLTKKQTNTADQLRRRDARDAPEAAAIVPPPATAAPAAPPAPAAAATRAAAAGFEDRAAPEPKVQADTVEVQTAATAERAPAESGADARKERARPSPPKLAAGSGAFSHPDDRALMTNKRYEALLARPATSAAQARALRDAWDLFARDFPADARADEARVRAIEAGVLAWTLGHDSADLATVRARGRAYLEAENAPQAARVRAALEALP
jgi:hypothetical protein